MSTFLNQSSLSTSASNTYSRVSLRNSSSANLGVGEYFFGDFEYCGNYSCIQIATYSSNTSVSVRLAQSYTNVIGSAIVTDTWTTTASQLSQKLFYCSLPFYRIIVENTSGTATTDFNLSTKLTLTAPQSEGGGGGGGATSALQQTQIDNDSTFYSTASPDLNAIRFISEEYLPLIYDTNTGTEANTATINSKIVVCDTQDVRITTGRVSVSGDVECYGKQSNFNFFPTPENNTINIYADETKGTNVVGGWNFINTGTPSKINWYIYVAPNPLGNPTSTGQNVGSVSSVYAVVNQLSVTTPPAYPYVVIYTRADSGSNAGLFKSRLVFQNTAPASTGIKLLYTGNNPVDIHPEITDNNRINLPFILGASTKPLEDALFEEILSVSLQTDSGLVAGSYNFTMAQFGIQWNPILNILPIQDGKVQVETGVVTCMEKSPTGAVTNELGILGDLVTGVSSTLQSINLSKIGGGGFAYVKLYNKATAPLATDTPVFTIPIQNNSIQQVECHSLAFPLGIGLRATLNFDPADTNAPSGTIYGTAFYTNIIQ